MGLSLVTAPASEPVSVAEAKSHMGVTISADDTKIGLFITAARQYAEGQTRRAFIEQTWDYTLSKFPVGEIELPLKPVTSVSYVQYVDSTGATQSFAETSTSPETPKWTLTTDGPRALVFPNYSLSWPDTRTHGNAVTVRFVAGYATVPEDIKQALFLIVAHWYENREDSSFAPLMSIPMGAQALLSAYKW